MEKEFKNYDLTALNEFFNESSNPLQLMFELSELLYNYAACVEDTNEIFKKDVGTLYCLHAALADVVRANNLADI